MKNGILSKPVEAPSEEIPEETIKKLYCERGQLIDNYNKSE